MSWKEYANDNLKAGLRLPTDDRPRFSFINTAALYILGRGQQFGGKHACCDGVLLATDQTRTELEQQLEC